MRTPQTSPEITSKFSTAMAIAALLVAAGCAGKKGASAAKNSADGEVNTGLEALASASTPSTGGDAPARGVSDTSLAALIDQQSSDLEKILSSGVDAQWASAEPVSSSRPSPTPPTATTPPIAAAAESSATGNAGFGLEAIASATPMNGTRIAMPPVAPTPAAPPADPLADAWAAAPSTAAPEVSVGPSAALANLATPTSPGMTPTIAAPANEPLPGTSASMESAADLWPEQVVTNDEIQKAPLEEKLDQAAVGFIDLLRQQAAASPDPLRPYVVLSVLEAMHPGATPTILSPEGEASIPLSDDQRQAVESLRHAMAGLVGNAGAATSTLTELAQNMDEHRPLRVASLQLCTSVRGFGQYTPVKDATFIAGRPARVIVYAELDGFRTRDISSGELAEFGPEAENSGDTMAVELVQEIALYHDADGLRVWSTPESKIIETSRAKRRDFYTVHTIELPSNLSVGSYKLKLVVRDATSGAVADVNVPIKIVAR